MSEKKTQVAKIMGLLRKDKFRERLLEQCAWASSSASAFFHGDLNDKSQDYLKGDWGDSLETAVAVSGIRDIIEEPIKLLTQPAVLLPGELSADLEVYLADVDGFVDEERYEGFLDHIEYRVLQLRNSTAFKLCTVSFPEGPRRQDDVLAGIMHGALLQRAHLIGDVAENDIKRSAESLVGETDEATPGLLGRFGDFDLTFRGVEFRSMATGLRKPSRDGDENGSVLVQVAGRASGSALSKLAADVARIGASHFQSVALLCAGGKLDVESFRMHLVFGIDGVKKAMLDTSNKDSFGRRIANAVNLLAEADQQRSAPIRLALCVTAIDALLGRKGAEMTKTLSDFVAGLLEPDVAQRRLAADYFENMYNTRSRVLHGDELDAGMKVVADARLLAASVLWGVWSYQDFFERFHQTTAKPDDFFKQLRQNFVTPGLPDGVTDLPVRALWRKA